MDLIIDRTYRLSAQLGQGGMGTVFSATEIVSGKWVALKLVSTAASTVVASLHEDVSYKLALTREFQTLASLHHPHLIRVLSYGFDEQHGSYYTMELLEQYWFSAKLTGRVEGKGGAGLDTGGLQGA